MDGEYVGDPNPQVLGAYQLVRELRRRERFASYHATTLAAPSAQEFVVHLHYRTLDPVELGEWCDHARRLLGHRHPNLAPVLEAGENDARAFVTTAFVEGRTLREVWNRCAREKVAFPIEIVAQIIRDLCTGLEFAHGAVGNLVCGAVPPAAIALLSSGQVQIDLGLAASLRRAGMARRLMLNYMSPEEVRGAALGPESSVYSVGILLWELLRGKVLFPRRKSPGADAGKRPLFGVFPPGWVLDRVPEELDKICARALKTRPRRRYQRCGDLAADLERFLVARGWEDGQARLGEFMNRLFEADFTEERALRAKLFPRTPARSS